jgi:hypothetical protein
MTGYRRMTAALFAGPALMLGLAMPTAAFANDYTGPPPSVQPKVLATQFETQPAAEPKTETLPFTGSDVTEMALIGAGAVLAGVVAVRRGRRRSVTPA